MISTVDYKEQDTRAFQQKQITIQLYFDHESL